MHANSGVLSSPHALTSFSGRAAGVDVVFCGWVGGWGVGVGGVGVRTRSSLTRHVIFSILPVAFLILKFTLQYSKMVHIYSTASFILHHPPRAQRILAFTAYRTRMTYLIPLFSYSSLSPTWGACDSDTQTHGVLSDSECIGLSLSVYTTPCCLHSNLELPLHAQPRPTTTRSPPALRKKAPVVRIAQVASRGVSWLPAMLCTAASWPSSLSSPLQFR